MLSELLIATTLLMPSVDKQGGKLSRIRSEVKGQPSRDASRGDARTLPGPSFDGAPRREDRPGRVSHSGRTVRRAGRRGTGVGRCCRYLDYPYFNGAAGYASLGPVRETSAEAPEPQAWAGRVAAETAYDFDGLVRTGMRAMLLTPSLVEVHLHADAWLEPLDRGGLDAIGLLGAGLAYRIGSNERSEFRIGAEYRQFMDSTSGRPGIRFFADTNIFFGPPVVVGFGAGAGMIGDAPSWDIRGTLGVMAGPVEVYIGADYERIGDIPIGGPVLGLQLWL